jgi:hypothetical protein
VYIQLNAVDISFCGPALKDTAYDILKLFCLHFGQQETIISLFSRNTSKTPINVQIKIFFASCPLGRPVIISHK